MALLPGATRTLAVGCYRASLPASSELSVESREAWSISFFVCFTLITLMSGSAQGILDRGLVGTRTQPQF